MPCSRRWAEAGLGVTAPSWQDGGAVSFGGDDATAPSHIGDGGGSKGGSEKRALWTWNMLTTDRVAYAAKPISYPPFTRWPCFMRRLLRKGEQFPEHWPLRRPTASSSADCGIMGAKRKAAAVERAKALAPLFDELADKSAREIAGRP